MDCGRQDPHSSISAPKRYSERALHPSWPSSHRDSAPERPITLSQRACHTPAVKRPGVLSSRPPPSSLGQKIRVKALGRRVGEVAGVVSEDKTLNLGFSRLLRRFIVPVLWVIDVFRRPNRRSIKPNLFPQNQHFCTRIPDNLGRHHRSHGERRQTRRSGSR